MKRKIVLMVLTFCLTMGLGTTAYAAGNDEKAEGTQNWEAPAKAAAARSVTEDEPDKPTTGWKTENGQRYYVLPDGSYETGYKQIDGKYYYFNASGVMQTGSRKIGGSLYWFHQTGEAMEKGWVNCDLWFHQRQRKLLCNGFHVLLYGQTHGP